MKLVKNWQTGWKWFSNLAFAGVVGVQAFFANVPPELIAQLPSNAQSWITVVLAVLGIVGRFVNQSKPQ